MYIHHIFTQKMIMISMNFHIRSQSQTENKDGWKSVCAYLHKLYGILGYSKIFIAKEFCLEQIKPFSQII